MIWAVSSLIDGVWLTEPSLVVVVWKFHNSRGISVIATISCYKEDNLVWLYTLHTPWFMANATQGIIFFSAKIWLFLFQNRRSFYTSKIYFSLFSKYRQNKYKQNKGFFPMLSHLTVSSLFCLMGEDFSCAAVWISKIFFASKPSWHHSLNNLKCKQSSQCTDC